MNILKYIYLILVIYFYIYNPIFQRLGFGSIKPLLFLSVLYFLNTKRNIQILSHYKIEILFTLIIILYSILTMIWGSDNSGLISAYLHLIWFMEGFIIPLFVFYIFKIQIIKFKVNNLLVLVGSIAALISFILILNPELNSYVRNTLIKDTLDNKNEDWTFRGFSVAESSSYGYGIVQALIFGIALFNIHKNKIFVLSLVILTVSIFFNARTGILIQFASILFFVFFYKIGFLKKYFIISLSVLIGVLLFNYTSILVEHEKTTDWGLDFFTQLTFFISGQEHDGAFSSLLGEMIFLPEKFSHIIFGEGRDVFYDNVKNSDVGFIVQVFKGGVVYLILLLLFLGYFFNNFHKSNNDVKILFFFLTVLIIANMKGNALFVPNSFFRVITLYYVINKELNRISLNAE